MDIYCPRCGEPWDSYEIYHEFTAEERSDFKSGIGCSYGCKSSPIDKESDEALMSRAALEVCGDDLDGVASLCDDWSYLNRS